MDPDDFHQEGSFKAYVKYIEDRCQARVVGEDPKLVELVPRISEEGGIGMLRIPCP